MIYNKILYNNITNKYQNYMINLEQLRFYQVTCQAKEISYLYKHYNSLKTPCGISLGYSLLT